MKRAALGALLISLVAGSTAMAGTVFRADQYNNGQRKEQSHRQDHRNDGRRDNDHRSDHRNDRRDDHRDNRSHDRRDDHRWDGRRDDHRGNDNRHNDRNWNNRPRDNHNHNWNNGRRFENGRYHWGSYHRPHGYVVRHWSRGDRLPRGYYAPTYVIRDYHECGLRRPPHGYHWVRVDHNAVLAVIATGVVLNVIYNQFW